MNDDSYENRQNAKQQSDKQRNDQLRNDKQINEENRDAIQATGNQPAEATVETTPETTPETTAETTADGSNGVSRRRRSRRGRSAAASIDYTVPSPCIAVCEYNDAGLCKGCLRNADEIRDWMILSREQKLQVLDQVAERRLKGGTC